MLIAYAVAVCIIPVVAMHLYANIQLPLNIDDVVDIIGWYCLGALLTTGALWVLARLVGDSWGRSGQLVLVGMVYGSLIPSAARQIRGLVFRRLRQARARGV